MSGKWLFKALDYRTDLAVRRALKSHFPDTTVRIVAPTASNWLERLPRRDGVVVGDPEDLVHIDWSEGWKPDP